MGSVGTSKETLATLAIYYCDRNSRNVLDSGSTPFSQWCEVEDTFDGVTIWFRCQQSPYSNGSSAVKVWHQGKLVLSATGNGFLGQMKVRAYQSGPWEQTIR